MRSGLLVLAGVVSLLGACTTSSLETEQRCSQGANGACPAGSVARTESDYRKEVDAIDDARCRSMAGNSVDAYRNCLARYEKDRR